MPENTFPAFHEVAWSVHKLVVRNPAVIDHFHEKIQRWYLDVKLRDIERDALMQQREKHIDTILANPRFRDKSADPPRPGWEWWQINRHIDVQGAAGRQNRCVSIEGWAPRELVQDEPELYWPLPLSKRPLRIEEKYTLLAAVHDHFCKGVKRIGPWSERDIQGMKYGLLCRHDVPELLKSEYRPAVEAFLADVEADLRTAAVHPTAMPPSEAVRQPQGGGGDADADTKTSTTDQDQIDVWLEETIPSLDTNDEEHWITAIAASRELKSNVSTDALKTSRSRSRARYRHSKGTVGIDGKRCWWRQERNTQDIWYYVPSLSDDFEHRDAHI